MNLQRLGLKTSIKVRRIKALTLKTSPRDGRSQGIEERAFFLEKTILL